MEQIPEFRSNFYQDLPKKPYCSYGKGTKTYIRSKKHVIQYPLIQVNHVHTVQYLIFDLAKEKGKLGPIEDFGRGQAEPVMMIFGYLRTFFSRWPYSFVGKTEDVIRKEMDEDIAKMVSSIQTDITRKIGETIDLSYYDAMQALIESGKTPDEIISLVS